MTDKPILHLRDAARGNPSLVFESSIAMLWTKKYDTFEIARLLNVRESVVYNRMIEIRSE